ncbi:protein CASP-like isoform X2 [Xenopus tropicalis]|uniref:Protein CASP-like isoform X2 n=1 Tax=Xenopus tropicalis TaxID=8364 RepID=A0A8J1JWZ4_XENTR|nr:protein CASP-like isoform X2 [Xenopus tropicalis]
MTRGTKTFWYFLLFILLINLCRGSAEIKDPKDETSAEEINEDIERMINDYRKQFEDVTGKTTSVQTAIKDAKNEESNEDIERMINDYNKQFEDVTGKTTSVQTAIKDAKNEESNEDIERMINDYRKQFDDVTGKTTSVQTAIKDATNEESNEDIERMINDYRKQFEDVTGKTTSVQTAIKDAKNEESNEDIERMINDYNKQFEDVTGKTTSVQISEDDSNTNFDETKKSITEESRIQATHKQEEDVEEITSGVERQIANQMRSTMTTTTNTNDKIRMMVKSLENNNQMNLIIICSVLGSGFLMVIAILLCIARSLSKLSREKDQLSEAEQGNL